MRIALVRGSQLNPFESPSYEPLQGRYDITGFASKRPQFDLSLVRLPVRQLHSTADLMYAFPPKLSRPLVLASRRFWYGMSEWMFGLEHALSDYQIAHVVDTVYGFSYQAARAKTKHQYRIVVTSWENIPFNYESSSIDRKVKSTVYQNADHFIPVTPRGADVLRLEGVPSDRITVIPVGVDVTRFRPGPKAPELLRRYGLSGDELIVLFIGRLAKEKGVYDLVHAAKLLSDDDQHGLKNVRWLFVGNGPEKLGLERRIGRLGLQRQVLLLGDFPHSEMPGLHRLADIFVLPSGFTRAWQEQFGMVLIESMASGRAIVSTLSGSIPDVVGDAGTLVQPGSPRPLAQAMRQLLASASLRNELGIRARERAEKLFDAKSIAQQIGEVYSHLSC